MDGMILINLKFTVQPERADEWMDAVAKYTADVRSEPGNLFFEWYRPVEGGPNEYFLLEGFTDEGAQAHVASPHFQEGLDAMRPLAEQRIRQAAWRLAQLVNQTLGN